MEEIVVSQGPQGRVLDKIIMTEIIEQHHDITETFKKVVELQHHAFHNLWKTAIPAEQRIKEIEIEVGADDSRGKESHKTIQSTFLNSQDWPS